MPQMTVLEILNRTKAFFEKKGVPDPLLDAQYIISHGLGMKNRMDLYLNFEKPLTPAELDVLRPLVARRAAREPLQHIVGDTSFRGHSIKCDPRALVPRPETEELVDMAKNLLNGIETPFIVEVGTGTGAIAIACAKEIGSSRVLATDISEEALALAKENAEANGLGDAASAAASAGDNKAGDNKAAGKSTALSRTSPTFPTGKRGSSNPKWTSSIPLSRYTADRTVSRSCARCSRRPKASLPPALLFCSKSGRNRPPCCNPKPPTTPGWNSPEATKTSAETSVS